MRTTALDETDLTAFEAIQNADNLLPGEECDDHPDPRWQAVIAVGEFVESHPQPVWEFVKRWGAHSDEDLRMAIATCILEHLLEYHFELVFPRVEQEVRSSPLFAYTLQSCWKFGRTNVPENSARFDALMDWCREQSRNG